MKKFILIKDHPFYPEVEYSDSKEELEGKMQKVKEEDFEEDGDYHCTVTIAKIIKQEKGKSHY